MFVTDIWVDKATGTWGVIEDLVIIGRTALDSATPDTESIVAYLDNCSDSEIVEFAEKYGIPVNRLTKVHPLW